MCHFCAEINPDNHIQSYAETPFYGATQGQYGSVISSKAAYGKYSVIPNQAEMTVSEGAEFNFTASDAASATGFDVAPSGAMNALIGGSWNSNTITYSFSGPHSNVGIGQHGPVKELSQQDRQTVEGMLQLYANVANVTFQETTGWANIDFRMEQIPSSVGGYASLPTSGRVTFDSLNYNGSNAGDPNASHITSNHWSWFAAIHEIGHAMGLLHPFAGGNSTVPKSGFPGSHLNAGYTVMSYRDGSDGNRDQVTGLQLYDIAAIQQIYGANYSYNSGDNAYYFDGSYKAYAQWDGGGSDTFYTDVSQSVTFDLRDGDYLNKVGQTEVKIAYGAEIENAIGGNGDDKITGNALDNYLYGGDGSDRIYGREGNDVLIAGDSASDQTDGNDLLIGGDGDDLIFGNAGNDTLIGGNSETNGAETGSDTLYGGSGDDRIIGNGGLDWLIGGPGTDSLYGGLGDDKFLVGWGNGADLIIGFDDGDQVRVMSNVNGTGVSNYQDLVGRMSTDGTHTWINLANAQGVGGGILIAWHTPNDLDASDFLVTSNLFA